MFPLSARESATGIRWACPGIHYGTAASAEKSNVLTYDGIEARVGINRFIIFAKFCPFYSRILLAHFQPGRVEHQCGSIYLQTRLQ